MVIQSSAKHRREEGHQADNTGDISRIVKDGLVGAWRKILLHDEQVAETKQQERDAHQQAEARLLIQEGRDIVEEGERFLTLVE
jgi:hypothetical protein